jgi:hypothetical protein
MLAVADEARRAPSESPASPGDSHEQTAKEPRRKKLRKPKEMGQGVTLFEHRTGDNTPSGDEDIEEELRRPAQAFRKEKDSARSDGHKLKRKDKSPKREQIKRSVKDIVLERAGRDPAPESGGVTLGSGIGARRGAGVAGAGPRVSHGHLPRRFFA